MEYAGVWFRTVREGRWAVFFDHLGDHWSYNPDGHPLGRPHYQPQFHVTRPGVSLYLEVRDTWNRWERPQWKSPTPPPPTQEEIEELEEPTVFLAVGELPPHGWLYPGGTGWWNPDEEQGVLRITQAWEWDDWYPRHSDEVLAALEAARTELLLPGQRPETTEAGEIRTTEPEED